MLLRSRAQNLLRTLGLCRPNSCSLVSLRRDGFSFAQVHFLFFGCRFGTNLATWEVFVAVGLAAPLSGHIWKPEAFGSPPSIRGEAVVLQRDLS